MVTPGDQYKKNRRRSLLALILIIAIVVLLNILLSGFFYRIDLTSEKRYSLSDGTKELLEKQSDIIYVKIYFAGDLSPNLKKLQQSTVELLNQFGNYAHDNIQYQVVDPLGDFSETEQGKFIKSLHDEGVYETEFLKSDKTEATHTYLFPFAEITYHDKTMPVMLLDQFQPLTPDYDPSTAISLLEYKFTKAILQVTQHKKTEIAFIQGEGELDTLSLNDIAASLNELYTVNLIDLPHSDFIDTAYKTIIIAKPTLAFSTEDKYKIDQYILHGGNVLWVIDPVIAEFDSLMHTGEFVAVDYDLNIMDQLIQYGARVNTNLIEDKQCTHIMVPYGNSYQPRPFPYNPVLNNFNKSNPVARNVDAIEGKFVSTIDTTKVAGIEKTFLLSTSNYSRYLMSPVKVSYNIVQYPPGDKEYNKPDLPVAVLLEGSFSSAFQSRKPTAKQMESMRLGNGPFIEKGIPAKQIIISDGDMIRNYIAKDGKPYPLGWNGVETNQFGSRGYMFGNKDFIMNCIGYLSGNKSLIETRAKEIKLRPLDTSAVAKNRIQWQIINIAAPLVLLYLFSGIYNYIRIRKYTS